MSDSNTNTTSGGIGCLGLIIIGALFGWAVLDLSPKAAVILGFKFAVGFTLGAVALALVVAVVAFFVSRP